MKPSAYNEDHKIFVWVKCQSEIARLKFFMMFFQLIQKSNKINRIEKEMQEEEELL